MSLGLPIVMTATGAVALAAYMAWKRQDIARQTALYGEKRGTPVTDKAAPASAGQAEPGIARHIVDRGRMVRGFDMDRNPPHWGVDIGADVGTPVHAAKSGDVLQTGPITGYGDTITIRHANGIESTLYGHLSRIDVSPGQQVAGGQVIGAVGRTSAGPDGLVPSWGQTMGAHLHMEVHPRGIPILGPRVQRTEPTRWLVQNGIQPFGERG